MPNDSPFDGGLSRRSVLKVGAAGCTTAIAATALGSTSLPHSRASLSKWQAAVGQDFQIVKKSLVNERSFKPVNLRLVDVVQLKTKTQPGHTLPGHIPEHAISICFEGSMRTELESATYKVVHPELGECQLFVNQIQTKASSTVQVYESILS